MSSKRRYRRYLDRKFGLISVELLGEGVVEHEGTLYRPADPRDATFCVTCGDQARFFVELPLNSVGGGR